MLKVALGWERWATGLGSTWGGLDEEPSANASPIAAQTLQLDVDVDPLERLDLLEYQGRGVWPAMMYHPSRVIL